MSEKPWFNAEKKAPPTGALIEISRDAGLSIMNRVKWNAATPVKGLYWREIEPPEEAVQLAGPLPVDDPAEDRLVSIEAAIFTLAEDVKRLQATVLDMANANSVRLFHQGTAEELPK